MIISVANPERERILLVENDPEIVDLIGKQALQGAGYETVVVNDAPTAISSAIQKIPDMIIVDLGLPGLSAKDMMVALSSQNIQIPVVVLAQKLTEGSIIQAFRLGAMDYLQWPVRETEVINVVERVLKQVRERRERERLARQVQQTNQELKARVRELTSIFSIGKAVTSITNKQLLFEKILEGAVSVTQADLGWFMVWDEASKIFLLAALRNFPPNLTTQLNQPWDDGISSLVAMSGTPLSIYGEPLRRFKIANLGQSAMIVPVKAQAQVIALLVMMRKKAVEFSTAEQNLLEAVADYAAISLSNVTLFHIFENRVRLSQLAAESAWLNDKIHGDLLQNVRREIRPSLEIAEKLLDQLVKSPINRRTNDQNQIFTDIQDQLLTIRRIAESISLPSPSRISTGSELIRLNDVVQKQAALFSHFAQQSHLTLATDIPVEPLLVQAEPGQLAHALGGLLSHAIKYCNPGGHITIKVALNAEQVVYVSISDKGREIDQATATKLFDPPTIRDAGKLAHFGGLGISLNLVKEIITRYKGKIWIESKAGEGTSFRFSLPIARK